MLKSVIERTPKAAMVDVLQNTEQDVEIVAAEVIGEDSIDGMSWNVYAVKVETRAERDGLLMNE